MNPSALFVARPVATTLLTMGVVLAGVVAFFKLPVSPLPQVDFPTISLAATMPGASPETMATSVATPLERHLSQIADVSEMTSSSSVGTTSITLQFGLNRDIDGAARDVQAAINAAHADLPTALRANPTYRKVNPADSPILVVTLTSKTETPGQLYDWASTVLAQKLSQVDGIGQVTVGGSSLPAVRVELLPQALFKYGIGLEDVRAALAAANANSPKGAIEEDGKHFQVYTNDQARTAKEYRSLIIAYRNKAPVRLSDLAEVKDSVEDLRNFGLSNGRPAVLLILNRQPNANIIATVDRVRAALPSLRAALPADIDIDIPMDRTPTIRASLSEVERTLAISLSLVVLTVFLFLRDGRATLIPAIAVPVSIIGTFASMYLLNYSLNNLSLMALTISTGFVVDDAIVVLENTVRHMEDGMPRMKAALQGAREVSFTVLSMSLSLIAVFLPILLMGGILGRLFREFAVTLSVAILVSLVVSLTVTPMLCSRILRHKAPGSSGWLTNQFERAFNALLAAYEHTLHTTLRHPLITIMILFATILFNFYLFAVVPKGFFPQQDTGRMMGFVQADQSISFQAMSAKMIALSKIVSEDPAVSSSVGFTGGSQTNTARVFSALKPIAERNYTTVDQVIARLRPKLAKVPGVSLFFQAAQDIRVGGRMSGSQYQYTLQADRLTDLQIWTPRLLEALKSVPEVVDLNLDQQDKGLSTDLVIDRDTASRIGLTASMIDNTLYDAFGQRQVSTIYNPLNQYHVVMEVAPSFWQNPDTLSQLWVSTMGGAVNGTKATNAVAGTTILTTATAASVQSVASDAMRNYAQNQIAVSGFAQASTGAAVSTAAEPMTPLAAFTHFAEGITPLAVNHQGHFAAATISFNLPVGVSLSDAVEAIQDTMIRIGAPSSVHGSFQGSAKAFQESLDTQPILMLAALAAVYIVLGVLYESLIHPITILSTLPSAGVGAVLALMAYDTEFSIIALIGVFLLIGIVKKNAIMMIDFAIDAERRLGLDRRDAIFLACKKRFRPIMMTSVVAMLGALPLALGHSDGSELRRPLGISVVGGLVVSQILTLYTTPVVYLYLDRFGAWCKRSLGFARAGA